MTKKLLFSVKKDKNIILYQISLNEDNFNKFLDLLDQKYSKIETDIVDTVFSGIIPLTYGKYDEMRKVCKVKDIEIIETKNSKRNSKINSIDVKEWEFLDEKEKIDFMPIEGKSKGKIKIEVIYPSVFAKILKETFSPSKGFIIDGTKLIKFYNHIYGLQNNFNFDKTIDLIKKNRDWNDPAITFLSMNDYERYLKNANVLLNKDDIEITQKEEIKIKDDFFEIFAQLQKVLFIEQIGMFPIDIELSEDLEILKKFAIRNEELDWLNSIFEYSIVNYNGGQIIGEMRHKIIENYDLDGTKIEKEILSKIEKKPNLFGDISKQKDKDGFSKKRKAA